MSLESVLTTTRRHWLIGLTFAVLANACGSPTAPTPSIPAPTLSAPADDAVAGTPAVLVVNNVSVGDDGPADLRLHAGHDPGGGGGRQPAGHRNGNCRGPRRTDQLSGAPRPSRPAAATTGGRVPCRTVPRAMVERFPFPSRLRPECRPGHRHIQPVESQSGGERGGRVHGRGDRSRTDARRADLRVVGVRAGRLPALGRQRGGAAGSRRTHGVYRHLDGHRALHGHRSRRPSRDPREPRDGVDASSTSTTRGPRSRSLAPELHRRLRPFRTNARVSASEISPTGATGSNGNSTTFEETAAKYIIDPARSSFSIHSISFNGATTRATVLAPCRFGSTEIADRACSAWRTAPVA